jgi:large subunit ribosomal protein L17
MRKRKIGRKFSRKRDRRKALIRSLLNSFFEKEKIKTTEAKAKEIKRMAEKFITKAKINNLAARRFLAKYFSERVSKKLLQELGPRYKERKGGYTRVVKLGQRKSDGAKMAIIELIE